MKDFYERIWKNVVKNNIKMMWTEKRLIETMKIIKPYLKNNCLDIACGYGMITNELNKMIPTQGFDISDVAIREAKRRYPHIKFKQGYVTNIPYHNNSFSTLFAGEIIEHVPDTFKMFSEFKRTLKPNGNLIIIVPEYNFIKNLIITLFFWEKIYNPFGEHIRFYTKKSLKEILKKFGFKVIYEHTEKYFKIIPQRMLVISKNKK